jgi:molybdenum cofactor biosynthesis enzyme MoaA
MKLYVIPTETLCNAKCEFCITKARKHIDSEFLEPEKLEKKLKKLKGVYLIEITGGGEPLLNPHIEEITRICCSKADTKLYTNGKKMHAHYALTHRIKELCISRSHQDDKINESIMGVSYSIDEIFKNTTSQIKLSLMLDKEGIRTRKGLMEYLNWAEFIGAYKVVVREMSQPMQIKKRFVSAEKMQEKTAPLLIESSFLGNQLYKFNTLLVEFDSCACRLNRETYILRSDANIYTDWDSIHNKAL